MGSRMIRLFVTASLVAEACLAQSPEEEKKYAEIIRQREATVHAVLQMVIPRIEWNGLSYEDAWCSLDAMIRAAAPAEEGDVHYEWSPWRYEIEADPFGSRPVVPPLLPREEEPALDWIWTNARNVKVVDAIGYLSAMKYYRFKTSGDGPAPGVFFILPENNWRFPEDVDLYLSAPARALARGDHLKKAIKPLENGWMTEALGWKGNLLYGAGIDPSAKIKWKDGDTKLRINGNTADIWKLRRYIASLDTEAISIGLLPLNKGELRLTEMCGALRKIKLPNLEIDAATLGEALGKLRRACGTASGVKASLLHWSFADSKLAALGPVHFKFKEGNASDALFRILFDLGCKFTATPDGRCSITARQMSDGDYVVIRQFKVPAALMTPHPQKVKKSPLSRAAKAASRDSIVCGGVTFPSGTFAMYSPHSETLIVRETAEGFLALRKGLNQLWRKAGFAHAPQR